MGYDELVESCLIDLFEADPINGRHLVGDILEDDIKNAKKWYWASDFIKLTTVDEKRSCIEEEIRKNPGNNIAKKALALFDRKFRPV